MPGFHSHTPSRTALLCAALLAAGCGRPAESAHPAHPERLNGVWVAQIQEIYSPRLTGPPAQPKVVGRVTLIPNEGGRLVRGFRGMPTHFGAYSADLDALGLPAGSSVPSLAVRLTADDSVQIAFDPQEPVPVRGSGRLRGDSISGVWYMEGGRNVGGAGGTFVLRRAEQDSPGS